MTLGFQMFQGRVYRDKGKQEIPPAAELRRPHVAGYLNAIVFQAALVFKGKDTREIMEVKRKKTMSWGRQ